MGIILFDGVCNLCNSSVQFILKRDQKGYFKFASIQGKIGQKLLKDYGLTSQEVNSVILIENNQLFVKSTAVLQICTHLTGFWKLFSIFFIFPPFLRDFFYDLVANNRYKWFGKKEDCILPSPKWKNRFLD